MKIAFFVNDPATEHPLYTTTGLAREAHRRGHEVWYLGVEDLAISPDCSLAGKGIRVPERSFRSGETFVAAVAETEREDIDLDDLDVFWLRNDPADDADLRPWARAVGIDFGQVLASRGTLVLNDPAGLTKAANKMYLQFFPEAVRPRTLITRDMDDIRAFIADTESDIVLKPLQGSGGDRVFVVRADDGANLNQIFEAVADSGYVMAQEYLPAASEGDIRFFLMNGRPLEVDGSYAAFKRVHEGDDLRNNMSAGGRAEAVEMNDTMLRIAEIVRPKLVEDGMFLVGLDIAGDRILEINVFSPGGLNSASELEGTDFNAAVVDAVEDKVEIVRSYGPGFANPRLGTL